VLTVPHYSYCQDSSKPDTFNIEDHEKLVYALTVMKTRMGNYKDLIQDWKSDEVRKNDYEDAGEKYGKVQGAMTGLIAQYEGLIDNNKPKNVKLDKIKPEFDILLKDYNDFIMFYREHKDPKPSFAVTTATVDFIINLVKSIDAFVGGKIKEKREKLKGQVDVCKMPDWGANSSGQDNSRPKAGPAKPDTTKG
jgi:hypothetical protein